MDTQIIDEITMMSNVNREISRETRDQMEGKEPLPNNEFLSTDKGEELSEKANYKEGYADGMIQALDMIKEHEQLTK